MLEAVTKEVVCRSQTCKQSQKNHQEIDNLVALIGFLSYVDSAPSPVIKNNWLPPQGELMNRISRKSFIPAAFFSLGIECLYDDHVRPHIWAWVLSKADAYTESTAALDRVRHNTRAKRQNVQKITGENAQEK